MTLPNFVVIGASKSGTTSLYYYLGEHPDIFMCPRQSPRFFSYEGIDCEKLDEINRRRCLAAVRHLEDYRALFDDVRAEKAIGEVTPNYFHNPQAHNRIKHHVPGAKLIAILRNPTDRAYSAYWMDVRAGREKRPFAEVIEPLARNALAVDDVKHYISEGLYCRHLQVYYDLFPSTQIRVYLTSDLKKDSVGTIQDMYRFIGVDDSFVPNTNVVHNAGSTPRTSVLDRVIHHRALKRAIPDALKPMLKSIGQRLIALNQKKMPPIGDDERRLLDDFYRKDTLALEKLIQRDLSAWTSR